MNSVLTQSLFFILVLGLLLSCEKKDNIANTYPEDQLTLSMESRHFRYHFSETDKEIIDTAWQEKYYEWLLDTLDIQVDSILEYFKYRDRDHLKRITGKNTNGFAEVGTYRFHSIWKIDNHESVHTIYANRIGIPPFLFNEGIAVAFQANYFKYPTFIPDWNGEDFHVLSKTFEGNGEIPPLDKLLGPVTYWDYDPDILYPISGSFVSFLINKYGSQKMKVFSEICACQDSKEKIHNDFSDTYGFTIEDGWNEWIQFIKSY